MTKDLRQILRVNQILKNQNQELNLEWIYNMREYQQSPEEDDTYLISIVMSN